jgi:hypothetical protein
VKFVHEFFSQIETLAKVAYWTDQDKALIEKIKLQVLALQYLNGRKNWDDILSGIKHIIKPDYWMRTKGRMRVHRILVTGAENCGRKQFEGFMMRLHKE